MIERDKLLYKYLEHIGNTLQQSPGTYSVRTETTLEIGTHLTLEKNIEQGEDRIEEHQPHSYEHTLKGDSKPLGHVTEQEGMKPGSSY